MSNDIETASGYGESEHQEIFNRGLCIDTSLGSYQPLLLSMTIGPDFEERYLGEEVERGPNRELIISGVQTRLAKKVEMLRSDNQRSPFSACKLTSQSSHFLTSQFS